MIFDKAWRAKRRAKKEARRDIYDSEEDRLKALLKELDPKDEQFNEKYTKIQSSLNVNNKLRKESLESRRRVPIGDKVSIILKVLGLGGIVAGAGTIIHAEREGMIFTGEKKTLMESITKTIGSLFWTK